VVVYWKKEFHMKILSDSSTLYTPAQAAEKGLAVFPLSVMAGDQAYRDLDTITSTKLLQLIEQGKDVFTSQPSIGEKMEFYESNPEESYLDVTMAQGLSGTYDSAVMAKNSTEMPENIEVFNSQTLCGPHRYMVDQALKWNEEGLSKAEIVRRLEQMRDHEASYLMPFDFSFLARGGRVSGMSAGIGSLLKLIPIMKKRDDGKALEKMGVSRTWKKAVRQVIDDMKKNGADESWVFFVSHANNPDCADAAQAMFESEFPKAKVELLPLSPAFIVQGGPGCVALQGIRPYTEQ
jgi:DegV family protein with EDD domain